MRCSSRHVRTALAVVATLAFAAGASAEEPFAGPRAFSFVALGDMPYKIPDDYPRFDRLIGVINQLKPAFSIHIGDIKSGSSSCGDETLKQAFDRFQTFQQPLIYTPGDNEWTDCHRQAAGKFNPRERLARVREMFYPKPDQSLGQSPLAVESQTKIQPEYAKYVENVRFTRNGVLFVMLHVVGSNNGFEANDKDAVLEYFDRNAANIAWLGDCFRVARETGAKAMVIAMQANMYDIKQKFPAMPSASGYVETVQAIERGAKSFGKPILLVQGDEHELEIQSFMGTNYKRVPNVLRLQVMGAEHVHAVRVIVDPDSPGVFGFIPVIVPENGPM
jgi:hypothetical protein